MPPEHQFTSSITVGELIYGAHKAESRTAILLQQIESILRPNLAVLPFDVLAASRYGEIRAQLERQGVTMGDADLRIASIALTRGLVVVTANVHHFRRVPELAIENWLE